MRRSPSYVPLQPLDERGRADFAKQILFSNGCWLWGGITDRAGYGIFGKPKRKAHRISYFLLRGVDPGNNHVCHRCDNPQCVRPDHLYLGDDQQNSRDMVERGRVNRWRGRRVGERNPRAKLTVAAVLQIRASDERPKVLAAQYGVSPAIIYLIRKREAWSHV
jgi:hypothetical protein